MRVPTRVALVLAGAMSMGVLGATGAQAAPVYVSNAYWTTGAAGLILHSAPTAYGRNNALDNARTAFDQAIRKAGRRPLTTGQYDAVFKQFKCHSQIARQKPQWNTESWRANVSYVDTLRAFCNPPRA